jgi:hypothetical protein
MAVVDAAFPFFSSECVRTGALRMEKRGLWSEKREAAAAA